jgi:integrase/recombinase XerD
MYEKTANNEVIIRLVGKITLEFPQINQLKVREIAEEIMYKYDVFPQETALMTTDIDDKLQLYFIVKNQEGLSKKTLKNYEYQLAIFANTLRKPLANVNVMDLRVYLANRCKNMKATSKNGQISILKSFFSWLFSEGLIPSNPTLLLKQTKEPKRIREPLTHDEVELLRQNCESLRESCLVEFAYSTGCRVSEIRDVNKDDINWHEMTLKVIGKGDKEREVCFNTKAKYLMKEYILSRSDDNPALFVAVKGKHSRLGQRSIEKDISKIASRANFTKAIYPHLLRHTIASHMLASGMSLHVVQSLLGHENPSTTQIYAVTSKRSVIYEYRQKIS